MPKRISNKPKSLFSNKSAIKSKQLLISCWTSYGILAALPIWCWLPHSLFYATGQTHQKNLRRLRILSSWNQPIILTRISRISQKARRFARACRLRRRREWASVATTAGLSAPRSAACSPFNRGKLRAFCDAVFAWLARFAWNKIIWIQTFMREDSGASALSMQPKVFLTASRVFSDCK